MRKEDVDNIIRDAIDKATAMIEDPVANLEAENAFDRSKAAFVKMASGYLSHLDHGKCPPSPDCPAVIATMLIRHMDEEEMGGVLVVGVQLFAELFFHHYKDHGDCSVNVD